MNNLTKIDLSSNLGEDYFLVELNIEFVNWFLIRKRGEMFDKIFFFSFFAMKNFNNVINIFDLS